MAWSNPPGTLALTALRPGSLDPVSPTAAEGLQRPAPAPAPPSSAQSETESDAGSDLDPEQPLRKKQRRLPGKNDNALAAFRAFLDNPATDAVYDKRNVHAAHLRRNDARLRTLHAIKLALRSMECISGTQEGDEARLKSGYVPVDAFVDFVRTSSDLSEEECTDDLILDVLARMKTHAKDSSKPLYIKNTAWPDASRLFVPTPWFSDDNHTRARRSLKKEFPYTNFTLECAGVDVLVGLIPKPAHTGAFWKIHERAARCRAVEAEIAELKQTLEQAE